MDHNIFETIERKAPGLSKGKLQIATYILQHPNEAAFQTAAQIGKTVQISESSVVRFANDLGYKGFPEFQRTLQEVVKSRLQSDLTPLHRETQVDPHTLQAEIEKFVDSLVGTQRLYLIASPQGELLIPYCKYSAGMIFDSIISLHCDSPETLFRDLSHISSGDAVICLCIGDISSLVCFALKQSKAAGAGVLLITDTDSDSIRSLGDGVISLPGQSEDTLPDISVSASILYRLFSLLMKQREKSLTQQKKRIEEIRNDYHNYESFGL